MIRLQGKPTTVSTDVAEEYQSCHTYIAHHHQSERNTVQILQLHIARLLPSKMIIS